MYSLPSKQLLFSINYTTAWTRCRGLKFVINCNLFVLLPLIYFLSVKIHYCPVDTNTAVQKNVDECKKKQCEDTFKSWPISQVISVKVLQKEKSNPDLIDIWYLMPLMPGCSFIFISLIVIRLLFMIIMKTNKNVWLKHSTFKRSS